MTDGPVHDRLTVAIECLQALVDTDSTEHPASDAKVSVNIFASTDEQFDAIVERAQAWGIPTIIKRKWEVIGENADGSPKLECGRFAWIGQRESVGVWAPKDRNVVSLSHPPTAAELADMFRPAA